MKEGRKEVKKEERVSNLNSHGTFRLFRGLYEYRWKLKCLTLAYIKLVILKSISTKIIV